MFLFSLVTNQDGRLFMLVCLICHVCLHNVYITTVRESVDGNERFLCDQELRRHLFVGQQLADSWGDIQLTISGGELFFNFTLKVVTIQK